MSDDGLQCRSVRFGYRRTARAVIEDLDHHFCPGEVTVVTGSSGCGKSTLMYLLSLMLRPWSGKISWLGQDLSALPDADRSAWRASASGFVFQDAMLDPARTVLDNVCEPALFAGIPRRSAHARAMELLDRFGVAHRAGHRPGEISGGQAQRVGLCRALLTNPRILFGDEPSGNLDAESSRMVWDALHEHARRGAVVIVATHDLDAAARADARLVLP